MILLVRLMIQPLGLRVEAPKGETIFEALGRSGVRLPSICGGRGLCGKCIVRVLKGEVSPPSSQELKLLGEKIGMGFRLACQTKILGDVEVEIPRESLKRAPRIVVEGLETTVTFNPMVREANVHVEKPSLTDLRADYQRLIDALKASIDMKVISRPNLRVVRKLPAIFRSGGWSVRVVYHTELGVLDVNSVDEDSGLYGLAVDIGTTKLVVYLVNLTTGKTETAKSTLNPQVRYGEDVISRISYASNPERTKVLQKAVIEGLNGLIEEACEDAEVSSQEIYEVVAVGNTAMHHIFLGITPKTLGLAPFAPVIQDSIDVPASELGLRVDESANLHVLPVVAGFVGADAVADVIATRVYESEEPSMVIDVGTNTEIILNNGENLYACSCASGPAFEGARIRHGMRAAEGAIERVQIDSDGVHYKVVGNVKPIGICGSGVVDAVSELLRVGLLSLDGKFRVSKMPNRFVKGSHGYEFILAKPEETGTGESITITQRDVREIQLAKSAIATGVSLLMREAGVELEELSVVYLAGSFGSYINPRSAVRIGLLPNVSLDRIKSVGNSAGVGAKMCLVSQEERIRARILAQRIRFVEFYLKPEFKKVFLENLNFSKAEELF
ncbi:DUF4445 domain-containing protein [Candidatus Bathyarchaeota archaeon]|nr:MAG: DUF4445 domain-containing protein [Candidatus Bathyarchaeota archaeon]